MTNRQDPLPRIPEYTRVPGHPQLPTNALQQRAAKLIHIHRGKPVRKSPICEISLVKSQFESEMRTASRRERRFVQKCPPRKRKHDGTSAEGMPASGGAPKTFVFSQVSMKMRAARAGESSSFKMRTTRKRELHFDDPRWCSRPRK